MVTTYIFVQMWTFSSIWKTEGKKKSKAFLEFRPYSAFTFGGRNQKPKAENFPFRPKVSASGIPLGFWSKRSKLCRRVEILKGSRLSSKNWSGEGDKVVEK